MLFQRYWFCFMTKFPFRNDVRSSYPNAYTKTINETETNTHKLQNCVKIIVDEDRYQDYTLLYMLIATK